MITMYALPFDSEVIINPETGEEQYDRGADSKDLADLIAAYFSNGILVRGSDLLTNELQVMHLSAMTCVVKPGIILINGRTGILGEQETLEFTVGESNPRIDRVVAELNIAERNIYVKVLKGTAAAAPVPPEVMQTEDIYQIPLAQIRINANQSVIASVTDERAGYISNVLLNQAPRTDVQAAEIKISEAVRNLYGLTVDNANVDSALYKVWDKSAGNLDELEYITTSRTWTPKYTGFYDVFLVGGGGGGNAGGDGNASTGYGGRPGFGGGGGFTLLMQNLYGVAGVTQHNAVIGQGGAPAAYLGDAGSGGTTTFASFSVKGGGGAAVKGGNGNSGGGGSVKIGTNDNQEGADGTASGLLYTGGTFGSDGKADLNNYLGTGILRDIDFTINCSTCGYCPLDNKLYGNGGNSGVGGGGGAMYANADLAKKNGGKGGDTIYGKGGKGGNVATAAGNGVDGSGGGGGFFCGNDFSLNKRGGIGGNGRQAPPPINYGDGGNGGNGGGGGGYGAEPGLVNRMRAAAGTGSAGTAGKQGVVIIRYHR